MIYLLRHGQDDESFIGGHSDVELTLTGISQVMETTNFLKNNSYKIERIISSDIKRARQTTEIVIESLNIPIEYTSMLRELDKGNLNGLPVTQAKILYPEFINVEEIYTKYPNGESMQDFYERIKGDIDKILALDNSLLVTHRGVINMLYFILNNLGPNMDKKQFGVEHASLHELDPKSKVIKKIK